VVVCGWERLSSVRSGWWRSEWLSAVVSGCLRYEVIVVGREWLSAVAVSCLVRSSYLRYGVVVCGTERLSSVWSGRQSSEWLSAVRSGCLRYGVVVVGMEWLVE
jgi:hypothetical protein